jgi:hypothetical protein
MISLPERASSRIPVARAPSSHECRHGFFPQLSPWDPCLLHRTRQPPRASHTGNRRASGMGIRERITVEAMHASGRFPLFRASTSEKNTERFRHRGRTWVSSRGEWTLHPGLLRASGGTCPARIPRTRSIPRNGTGPAQVVLSRSVGREAWYTMLGLTSTARCHPIITLSGKESMAQRYTSWGGLRAGR